MIMLFKGNGVLVIFVLNLIPLDKRLLFRISCNDEILLCTLAICADVIEFDSAILKQTPVFRR